MALIFISSNIDPSYLALSSDLDENEKIEGATLIGKKIFFTDTGEWGIIEEDRSITSYVLPVSMNVENVNIDASIGITQTEQGVTNGVVALPSGGIGSLTETAPATDTASSGLNGRLQRIAQRLTSLIALLPASLGQKTKAESLPVVLASDQDALAVTGTFYQATQPVSGPVTDTQLRATPVPVSGTVTASGPLTDTQLRASDVAVIPHGLADEIIVAPTLTVAGAYTSGDYVGTSTTPITFANCARVNGGTGMIVGAALIDSNIQSIAGELWLFDAPVAPPNDNAAWQMSGADMEKCIGVIPFSTYYGAVAASASFANAQSIVFKTESDSRSLYGCFVTRGTPTHTTGALKFKLRVWQD